MATSIADGGPSRFRRIGVVGVAIIACVGFLSACESSPSAKPRAHKKPPAELQGLEQPMQIDLVLTSTNPLLSVPIKGNKGVCMFPGTGLAATFAVTAADYPQLGPEGTLTVFGPTTIPRYGVVPPGVSAYVNGLGVTSPRATVGVTIDPTGKGATLNTKLYGGLGGSFASSLADPTYPLSTRVTGTIRCG